MRRFGPPERECSPFDSHSDIHSSPLPSSYLHPFRTLLHSSSLPPVPLFHSHVLPPIKLFLHYPPYVFSSSSSSPPSALTLPPFILLPTLPLHISPLLPPLHPKPRKPALPNLPSLHVPFRPPYPFNPFPLFPSQRGGDEDGGGQAGTTKILDW